MNLTVKFDPAARRLLEPGHDRILPALPLSAQAALGLALARISNTVVLWITAGPGRLEDAHLNTMSLNCEPGDDACSVQACYFPARECAAAGSDMEDPRRSGFRLRTLADLAGGPGRAIVVTCIQALVQKTVRPVNLTKRLVNAVCGGQLDPEQLVADLAESGYVQESEVREQGQVSFRRGLMDLWPPSEPWPLRIETFGTRVESIRSFDPETQKSVDRLDRALITPGRETALAGRQPCGITAYLPEDTVILWSDPEQILEQADLNEQSLSESGRSDEIYTIARLRSMIGRLSAVRSIAIGPENPPGMEPDMPRIDPVPSIVAGAGAEFQPDISARSRRNLLRTLADRAAAGQSVCLFADTVGATAHLRSELESMKISATRDLRLVSAPLTEGFISDDLKLAVVAEPDLYARHVKAPGRHIPKMPRAAPGAPIADLGDIEPGDLVVHVEHGIGRYLGLYEITVDGRTQEALTVEYSDNAKLHVPVSQAHLLTRYVGVSRHRPNLHKLGGKRWTREKDAAKRAIHDLASSLLDIQARRSLLAGHSFGPDTDWQREFEASFPYPETADQTRVITEVKRDMESTRPMDRLVCGDAGYGKTEVAMRAAFKTVNAGKQAAVLVPTTVLAQQHLDTFRQRMAPYPFRIEILNRFSAHAQRRSVLRGMEEGTVDIVIATHALLQPGIRFRDLGLVIIDEEQRFGVEHKEQLKRMRSMVDILTMTATPIPRTLYMSMTGMRDISVLQTPPLERLAVETLVTRNADKVIREALLNEIARGGQAFYLHNRVMTIDRARERLERLVPEARIDVAHGRMPGTQLASVMRRFVAREFDVLVCTTIVENGMDIPAANTILIDRADRFGLADLYQLRGRVGRSSHRAYAYLLLPHDGPVDRLARERIDAVRRYSGLSAGFNLALRDLELRGAGNILGAQQSGHIASLGFGLYCRLLKRAVSAIKGEPVPPVSDVSVRLDFLAFSPRSEDADRSAFIPYSYIEDERLRIAAYRRIAETCTLADVSELRDDLADRYGAVPEPVQRLLKAAEIRAVAAARDVTAVESRGEKLYAVRKGELIRLAGIPRSADEAGVSDRLDKIKALIEKL